MNLEIFESIIIIYSLINLFRMVKDYKKFYCIYPIIAMFDLVMVVPLFLEMILGIPKIPRDIYMNFIKAMEDETTLVIYCFFLILAQLMFAYELKRIKRRNRQLVKTNDIQEGLQFLQNFKYKKIVLVLCYIVILASVLSVVFSPDPLHYLTFRSIPFQASSQIL